MGKVSMKGVCDMHVHTNPDLRLRAYDDFELADAAIRVGARAIVIKTHLGFTVNRAYLTNQYVKRVYGENTGFTMYGGVVMNKYTGSRGKYGTSDASAEFVGRIRRILDGAGVVWQTAELGKVDAGGGGTVAAYIARHGINTVDLGVPVLSMHAPYETISKVDLYMTHLALCAFNSRD